MLVTRVTPQKAAILLKKQGATIKDFKLHMLHGFSDYLMINGDKLQKDRHGYYLVTY